MEIFLLVCIVSFVSEVANEQGNEATNSLALSSTYEHCPKPCSCTGKVINCMCICGTSKHESYDHIDIGYILQKCIPTSISVVGLDFYNCNLGTIPNESFRHLVNLTNLRMENCNITNLEPDALNGINALTELHIIDTAQNNPGVYLSYYVLHHCPLVSTLTLGRILNIENDAFEAFPQLLTLSLWHSSLLKYHNVFRPLRNLITIYSNTIGLTKIPDFILSHLPRLRNLFLIGNEISSLAFKGGVAETETLVVNLQYNRITALMKKEIAQFKNVSELSLELYNNDIRYIEPDLFNDIKRMDRLTFERNRNFGSKNFFTLIKSLKNKPVRILNLKACGIMIGKFNESVLSPLNRSNLLELHFDENTVESYERDAFKCVPSLNVLGFSNFIKISAETFSPLKNLTSLSIRDSLTVTPPYKIVSINLNELKDLANLFISRIDGARMKFDFGKLLKLRAFQLSYVGTILIKRFHQDLLSFLKARKSTRFTQIDLSGNLMFQYSDEDLCSLFKEMTVETMVLKKNYFKYIPTCMFKSCIMNKLDLAGNRITHIQNNLFQLQNLSHIDLSGNQIASIDGNAFDGIPHDSYLFIHNNLLACDCKMRGFRNWLQNRKSVALRYDKFCKSPNSRTREKILDYKITWLECNVELFTKICVVTGSCIILIITVTLSLLKFYWRDIKYRYMVRKARHHIHININQDNDEDVDVYDAFVSYHSERRIWVNQVMTRELCDGDINFTLIHDDNIIPGQESYFGGIMTHMDRSHHIIFLVTRGWMKEGWNEFEMNAAIDMLSQTKRHTLIVILMENIPQKEMSGELRLMVRNNICLKWSEEEGTQRKFWRDLKLELGKKKFNMK